MNLSQLSETETFDEEIDDGIILIGLHFFWSLLAVLLFLVGLVIGYVCSGQPSAGQGGAYFFGFGVGFLCFLVLCPFLPLFKKPV